MNAVTRERIESELRRLGLARPRLLALGADAMELALVFVDVQGSDAGGLSSCWKAVVADSLPRPPDVDRTLAIAGDHGVEVLLVHSESGAEITWHVRSAGGWERVAPDQGVVRLRNARDLTAGVGVARLVVEGLGRRNRRELGGDLARGYAGTLKRVFPGSELYLFELLQNAVDEDARRVSVHLEEREEALVFQHDGHGFSPLDVNGLCMVNRSGKSGRTIGFMGIGFKAVCKRFGRIRVRDRLWRFRFERTEGDGSLAGDGWIHVPIWDDAAPEPASSFTCRFDLQLPDGGVTAIRKDMERLPDAVPPLLGRRVLEAHPETPAWRLDWGARVIVVSRGAPEPEGVLALRCMDGARDLRWMLIVDSFEPQDDAVQAYRRYRDDSTAEPGRQDVCLFFEVGATREPVASDRPGALFAVLPTQTALPMGFSLQANWFLDAGRQQVQRDDPWNTALLGRVPRLIVRFLEWVARDDGPAGTAAAYSLLPKLQAGQLEVVGHVLDLEPIREAVRSRALVPVVSNRADETTEPRPETLREREHAFQAARRAVAAPTARPRPSFAPAVRTLLVPRALVEDLSPRFLRKWLGAEVFDCLGAGSSEGLWSGLGVLEPLTRDHLRGRAASLRPLLDVPDPVERAWRWVIFLGAVQRAAVDVGEGVFEDVPYPTEAGDLAIAGGVSRVDADYFKLPATTRRTLTPHLGEPRGLLWLPLLSELGDLRRPPESWGLAARGAWDRARGRVSDRVAGVVKVREAVGRYFTSLESRPLERHDIDEVVQLTWWAAAQVARADFRTQLIDRVIVDTEAGRRLVPTNAAILGPQYGNTAIATLGASCLQSVSSAYLDYQGPEDSGESEEESAADIAGVHMWSEFFAALRPEPVHRAPHCELELSRRIREGRAAADEFRSLGIDSAPPRVRASYHSVELGPNVAITSNGYWVLRPRFPAVWDRVVDDVAASGDRTRARALCRLLSQAIGSWPRRTFVAFIPHGKQFAERIETGQVASWLTKLRSSAWIPTASGVARPCDVLIEPDLVQPELPYADVEDDVRRALQPMSALLEFGQTVVRAVPPNRLSKLIQRPDANDDELVRFWQETVHGSSALSDDEVRALQAQALGADAFPVGGARVIDGKARVSLRRVIGGAGRFDRATLGGWVLRLRDPACPLAPLAEALTRLLRVPEHPTPEQAIDYLGHVWERRPSVTDVRDGFVAAIRILVQASPDAPVRRELNKARLDGCALIYCREPGTARRGDWVALRGEPGRTPVYDDDPAAARLLRSGDGYWTEGLLGRVEDPEVVERAIELLGLARLSRTNVQLRPVAGAPRPRPAESRRLRAIVRALEDRLTETDRVAPPVDLSSLQVMGCDTLALSLTIDGVERPRQEVAAAWDPSGVVYVRGESIDYGGELAEGLRVRFRLERRPDLNPLVEMAYLLSDERRFRIACGKHDVVVPESAPEGEPAAASVPQAPTGSLAPSAPEGGLADVNRGSSTALDQDRDLEPFSEHRGQEDDGSERADRRQGDGYPSRSSSGAHRGEGFGGGGAGGAAAGSTAGGSRRGERHTGPVGPGQDRYSLDRHALAQPAGERATRERPRPSHDDLTARSVVMEFERACGRSPREMPELHPGYDVESLHPGLGRTRRIEIKGLQQEWSGSAGVVMTGRQFRDASSPSPPGIEYWLYVVDRLATTSPRVRAIPNVARRTRGVHLRADDWAGAAVEASSPAQGTMDGSAPPELASEGERALWRAIRRRGWPVPLVGDAFADGSDDALLYAWPDHGVALTIAEEPVQDGTYRVVVVTEERAVSDPEGILAELEAAFRPG